MKLVTANLWGGRLTPVYGDFFKKYIDIDVWCFQEVFKDAHHYEDIVIKGASVDKDLFTTLNKYLPKHICEFCQMIGGFYGMVSHISKEMKLVEKGELFIAKGNWARMEDGNDRDHHRKAQWMELEMNGKKFLVVNSHLTHRPEGKKDSPKRLKQSKVICDFLEMFDCPKILVGDFNLLPDTESLQMFENIGMRNLVKEYGITSTRTELYKKPLRYADYIFVSDGVKVKDFKVLPEIISDHSPLYLESDIL